MLAPSLAISAQDVTIPHHIKSFSQAKRLLPKVYKGHRETFYCGCGYDKHKNVRPGQCGYEPRKNAKRGGRIEWEHIVPAHAFGHTRPCWREKLCETKKGKLYKGRRCCAKIDPVFEAMESDLHNLVPAVGELNGDRSNRSFGMVAGEPRVYGACDFEIDWDTDRVEPRPEVQGDVARAYFYMNATYGLPISKKQRRLFQVWMSQDPVDDWERERNRRIEKIQGNANPFVK
ncbi:endonuclease [Magnetofaba australis]|uniref:endonuclease n=1 Tax=Magnetofaba australis TaxID=1472297 RepID=UPI0018E9533F